MNSYLVGLRKKVIGVEISVFLPSSKDQSDKSHSTGCKEC